MLVPFCEPASPFSITSPPSTTILCPILSSSLFVINSTLEIAATLANASPLNPIDLTVSKSSAVLILLVACLSNANSKSSSAIPQPLSIILIFFIPPFCTSTSILVASASIEFSINSFTTDAGRSITSPAAIWLIVKSSNNTIFPTSFSPLFHCKLYHKQ